MRRTLTMLVLLAGLLLFPFDLPADPPEENTTSQGGETVILHLKDGSTIEGILRGFEEAVYRVEVDGQIRTIPASDVREIVQTSTIPREASADVTLAGPAIIVGSYDEGISRSRSEGKILLILYVEKAAITGLPGLLEANPTFAFLKRCVLYPYPHEVSDELRERFPEARESSYILISPQGHVKHRQWNAPAPSESEQEAYLVELRTAIEDAYRTYRGETRIAYSYEEGLALAAEHASPLVIIYLDGGSRTIQNVLDGNLDEIDEDVREIIPPIVEALWGCVIYPYDWFHSEELAERFPGAQESSFHILLPDGTVVAQLGATRSSGEIDLGTSYVRRLRDGIARARERIHRAGE